MLITTKEKKRESLFESFNKVKWGHISICVIGLFLSRIGLFGGFYTLGVCYVGAVFVNKDMRKWTSIMSLLGLASVGIFDTYILKYIFIIILMCLIRIYMNFMQIKFTARNQAIITSGSILIINSVLVAVNHFKFFNILVALLETVISIGLVIMLCYSTEIIIRHRKTLLTQKETISIAFLMACIVGGIIDFYITVPVFKEIYFRDVMTFVIIIAIIYLGGINIGIIMSLVISMVLVLIGYMPEHFVVIYALAALSGAIFSVLGRVGVIFSTGIGLLLGFALFNNRLIDMQVLGAYIIAGGVSLIMPESYLGMANWFACGHEKDDEKHLLRVQKIITEKLGHFSKAFYNLSHTFDKISDKKVILSEKDLNHIIEDTGEKMCVNCSMKEFCWNDYIDKTYQGAYEILAAIEEKGQLKLGDIPEMFKSACINAESFACTLGFKLDLFKQNLMWKNRIVESRNLMGQQFEAIAESISKLCQDIEKEFYFNKEDEMLIMETLQQGGIKAKDIMVLENNGRKQEIHVYMTWCKHDVDLREAIIKAIHKALNIKVEVDRIESNEEENYSYFKFKISKVYGILAGAAFHAKGEISGDVYSYMEVEEGKYLLALADGMGSGRLALEESTATIELLESFLDSGIKNDLAVKMINSALVLKSDIENFSTMDITLIDEYTGVAEFLKLGAATSFILRSGKVMTIESNTLPIGILKDVDLQICHKQLKDGDVIIMVTDGMLQGENELLGKEDTFKHFILEASMNNPSSMAEYLIKKSRDLLGNAENDDMTIIVARVWQRI